MTCIYILEYPFLNPQTVGFCNEIDIKNKINANCRQGSTQDSNIAAPYVNNSNVSNIVVTESSIQVDATFIDLNLQPAKRLRAEEISSEIVIDDDEFL